MCSNQVIKLRNPNCSVDKCDKMLQLQLTWLIGGCDGLPRPLVLEKRAITSGLVIEAPTRPPINPVVNAAIDLSAFCVCSLV